MVFTDLFTISSNIRAITWKSREELCLNEGWSEIGHDIVYPYYQDDEMLSDFSTLLNRLAGMADEMSSYFRRIKQQRQEQLEKEQAEKEAQKRMEKEEQKKMEFTS